MEKVNIDPLLKAYSKEGNPSYHPVMMLKVMVFAYMNNIYSSRKIEKALREKYQLLNYTIHQETNDFNTLKHHLENFEKLYGENRMNELKELIADAGYGSEQNYEEGVKKTQTTLG